jgi:hypothetical protein
MTASTALRSSVRAAFGTLIDYAGLFPPGELPLAEAVREYQDAESGRCAWMVGRFILPASLLSALQAVGRAPLSVIVEANADAVGCVAAARAAGARIQALEVPLHKSPAVLQTHPSRDEMLDVFGALETDLVEAGCRDLPTFVELPQSEPWRELLPDAMCALARVRLGAKLRCGGVTAEAFPSVDAVADFIDSAQRAGVAFKATAGLHHPIRHRDEATGFMMHGFVNIIAAAALASEVERATLALIVAEEEPSAFAFDDVSLSWRGRRIGLAGLSRTRRDAFISYGSCSISEPVDDLTALGLLASP